MTNILVTGANGQLGKELQRIAPSYPKYQFTFLSKEELPIQDLDAVRDAFNIHQPQFLINCAAYTAVDKAEEEVDPAYRINATAAGILAMTCRHNNCRLIHISTDYVFDGTAIVPYKEDALTNPQSVYGSSKLEGEKLVIQYDPLSIIIRTSWVYSEYGKNFVKTMLRLMGEKKEISVVNDQQGSPTYAANLAEAIMSIISNGQWTTGNEPLALDNKQAGIYHFSNKGIISWYDLAVAIKELTGSDCMINPIPTSSYPTAAKRPAYSVLDTTKIQKAFGLPMKPWKESLRVCLQRLK